MFGAKQTLSSVYFLLSVLLLSRSAQRAAASAEKFFFTLYPISLEQLSSPHPIRAATQALAVDAHQPSS